MSKTTCLCTFVPLSLFFSPLTSSRVHVRATAAELAEATCVNSVWRVFVGGRAKHHIAVTHLGDGSQGKQRGGAVMVMAGDKGSEGRAEGEGQDTCR